VRVLEETGNIGAIMRDKPTIKEKDVLRQCIDFLTIMERRHEIHWFTRLNTMGVYKDGAYYPSYGLRKGVSDIMCFTPDGVLFIECKGSTGRQSDEQKDFEIYCQRAGAKYIIVSDVGQLERYFYKPDARDYRIKADASAIGVD
jgi:hypothetical protein